MPRSFLKGALYEIIDFYRAAPYKKRGYIPHGVQHGTFLTTEEKVGSGEGRSGGRTSLCSVLVNLKLYHAGGTAMQHGTFLSTHRGFGGRKRGCWGRRRHRPEGRDMWQGRALEGVFGMGQESVLAVLRPPDGVCARPLLPSFQVRRRWAQWNRSNGGSLAAGGSALAVAGGSGNVSYRELVSSFRWARVCFRLDGCVRMDVGLGASLSYRELAGHACRDVL